MIICVMVPSAFLLFHISYCCLYQGFACLSKNSGDHMGGGTIKSIEELKFVNMFVSKLPILAKCGSLRFVVPQFLLSIC